MMISIQSSSVIELTFQTRLERRRENKERHRDAERGNALMQILIQMNIKNFLFLLMLLRTLKETVQLKNDHPHVI